MAEETPQTLYSVGNLEVDRINCKCRKVAKYYHANSYYYSRWYCPGHRVDCFYRWLDKAKRLPKGYDYIASVRTSFLRFPAESQITECLHEYWRLLRKVDPELLYFGRLHYTPDAGLHFHFALAMKTPISDEYIRDSWIHANITKLNQEPPTASYVESKYTWIDAVKYALLSGSNKDGDWQLPPEGLVKQLVRCSRQFKGVLR